MPKDPEDHPPQVPLRKAAPALKQLRRRFLLPGLVLCPGVTAIATRLRALEVRVGLPPLVGLDPGEDEHGLDMEPFEDA